jgi:hypothetical protein
MKNSSFLPMEAKSHRPKSVAFDFLMGPLGLESGADLPSACHTEEGDGGGCQVGAGSRIGYNAVSVLI